MKIATKGESAQLGGMTACMVTLAWKTEADFDLAALFVKKDGTKGMVYFNELGDLNKMPYMKLDGDAGVGDTLDSADGNKETMRISQFTEMSHIHIIAWDYGAVTKGSAARFKDSDVAVTLTDDSGESHNVTVDTGDLGNVCILATIDNTNAMGATLVNQSKVGTLKGLNDSQQLFDILN